jgi:hypothetical protein
VSGMASHHTTGGSQPVGREVALIRMKGGWGLVPPPAFHEIIGKPHLTCGTYLSGGVGAASAPDVNALWRERTGSATGSKGHATAIVSR